MANSPFPVPPPIYPGPMGGSGVPAIYQPQHTNLDLSKILAAASAVPVGSSSSGSKQAALQALHDSINQGQLSAQLGASKSTQDFTNLLKSSGRTVKSLDPKLQSKFKSLQATEKKTGIGNPNNSQGFLGRVMDVLSRPNYAVANMFEGAVKSAKDAGKNPLFYGAGNPLTDLKNFWGGLSGHDKTHFSDVLQTIDPHMNSALKGVLGFGLDVALDPTSYIGAGVIKDVVGKGAEAAVKGTERLAQTRSVASDLADAGIHMGPDPAVAATEAVAPTLGEAATKLTVKGAAPADTVDKLTQVLNTTGQRGSADALHIADANKFAKAVHQTAYETTYAKTYHNLMEGAQSLFRPTKPVIRNISMLTEHVADYKAASVALKSAHGVVHNARMALEKATKSGDAALIASAKKGLDDAVTKLQDAQRALDTKHGVLDVTHITKNSDINKAINAHPKMQALTDQITKAKADRAKLVSKKADTTAIDATLADLHGQQHALYAKLAVKNQQDIVKSYKDSVAAGETLPHTTTLQESVVPKMTPAEKKANEAYNAKLETQIREQANQAAHEKASSLQDAVIQHLTGPDAPQLKRAIAVNLHVPFTKMNNPTDAMHLFAVSLPDTVSKVLFKFMNGDNAITKSAQVWKNTFVSSHGIGDAELKALRNKAGNFPAIMKIHTLRLRKEFGKVSVGDRRAALDLWKKNLGTSESGHLAPLTGVISQEIDRLAQALTHGGYEHIIPAEDWQKLVDKKYKDLIPHEGLKIWSDLHDAHSFFTDIIRRAPANTDPAELLWNLHQAKESVAATDGLRNAIRDTFGNSVNDIGHGMKQALEAKGYRTVKGMGEDHLFQPETAKYIDKTLSLIGGQGNPHEIMHYYDKVLRAWKMSVTLPSPGYHMRNSFGDGFMNWLNGVQAKSYYGATKVLRTIATRESRNNALTQAMQSPEPWSIFKKYADLGPSGVPVVTIAKGPLKGHVLHSDEIAALFSENGLHASFTPTEFKANLGIHSNPALAGSSAVLHKMMDASQGREDLFRMANFIHTLERSTASTVELAAQEAAQAVRRFNIDYTDFTKFEKGATRVIPFYKWTRKALPLMIQQVFAQPGKMLVYPKAMHNLSNAMGWNQDNPDQLIPEWLRQQGLHPLWQTGPRNDTVYGNVPIPANQMATFLGQPLQSAVNMLTPGLTIPIEQATGKKLFNGAPTGSMGQYVEKQNPYGSLIAALMKQGGNKDTNPGLSGGLTNPRLLQFLTGLSLTQNTDSLQQNEWFNRSATASAANKALKAKVAAQKKKGH